jgi:hypothetical protein
VQRAARGQVVEEARVALEQGAVLHSRHAPADLPREVGRGRPGLVSRWAPQGPTLYLWGTWLSARRRRR